MEYDVLIGLEIHAELKTNSKMFCGCKNPSSVLGTPANTTICPICTGHPGTLPTINWKAVEYTVLTGLALGSTIARHSKFDRKHYFYPDLPKGYQISQYDMPLCTGGHLEVGGKDIDIIRVHLEEDTGKLAHEGGASLVDYNRSSVPLMELVSSPMLRDGRQAREFAENYRAILRSLGVSDADMEKGQMRVEANISVQEHGAWMMTADYTIEASAGKTLNPKIEIKNLNSFRSVEGAISFEIARQKRALDQGEPLVQETRGWDEVGLKTKSQRVKEEAMDYRYFPEPDLPPLELSDEYIEGLRARLPELPREKLARFMGEYGLNEVTAKTIVAQADLSRIFEEVMSELLAWVEASDDEPHVHKAKFGKVASNWLVNNAAGILMKQGKDWANLGVTSEDLAEFLMLLIAGTMNSTVGKAVLEKMLETGKDPHYILEEGGFGSRAKVDLATLVDQVIATHPKEAEQYKAGKKTLAQFFVGQAMKLAKGQADPQELARLVVEKLGD